MLVTIKLKLDHSLTPDELAVALAAAQERATASLLMFQAPSGGYVRSADPA